MTARAGRVLRMAYLVAAVAGVAFFVMSVVLLGVWPGRVLDRQVRAMSPEQPLGLTVSEERGRTIYGREGCAYCHTQQIRFVAADMRRFGAPTLAWETRFDFPHLWGTRRIGPDLARAGSVRTDDWHFAHLFAPRSVVTDSVMPSYAWMFDGAPDRPSQSARDLVSYLQSLGRARELAGPEGEARARERCDCAGDHMMQMAFGSTLNASSARTRPSGTDVPALPVSVDERRGQQLYAANCASCHGPRGAGDGPGAAALAPAPSDLSSHEYATGRIADVLWNGVAGTAMQAWREYPREDLAAIAGVVQRFHVAQDASVPESLVASGERVYAAHCVQCHGPDGRGDGSASGEFTIAPTNFRIQRPSMNTSLRAMREGVRGTRMASWTGRLSESEIVAVTAYVRSLYEGDGGR
jgi:cytochrome c oxidase cbb3-type subunit 2/cytochrome c oxidase cbb3-type subunit I/II